MSLGLPIPPSLLPRPHFIVADDDPQVRRVLVAFLQATGPEVIDVADGTALLERIERDPSACAGVVMDARMPGPPLVERVRRLRAACARLPIIVVTGDPLPALEQSADRDVIVLGKPFGPHDLLRALSDAGAAVAA